MMSKAPADTWARYQIDGIWVDRCGSLASIGAPVAVSDPSTTQLFEPIASFLAPPNSRSVTAGRPSARVVSSARHALDMECDDGSPVCPTGWCGSGWRG